MFTSRLPKSTSARRPSNPSDGSTSMFGTNIPVSVRKANLFTPQPKRSLQTGLSSTSRKSYLTTDKKYQRTSKPVPDRDEQIRMFEALVEFLRKNAPGFPIPEAKRFFSSVSTTETSRLFEFLLSQLLPEFKINKLEIDVPEALTHLGYPYIRSVTKSALVSITTRQAIVNLLVIFNWLIDFIETVNAEDDLSDVDRQQSSPVKIFANILNNPDATNEEMRRAMQNKATNSESACRELDRINTEYEQLMEKAQEIEQLVKERKAITDDLEASTEYFEKISKYCAFRKTELEEIKEIRLKLVEELENKPKEDESLMTFVDLEARQKTIRSNIFQLNETIKLRQQALKTDIHNRQEELSKVLTDTQKVEKEFTRKRQEFEFEETKLTKLRETELSNFMHDMKKCAEVDELNLQVLRTSLDRNRQEAISLVKIAERERDRWNKMALIYKENSKIAKKVSKRLVL